MLTVHALERVQAHRARIDEHIDTGVALLRLHPERARRPLAIGRWRMLQMLRHYHLYKRVELFEPAMRSDSPDLRRQAQAMLRACQAGWEAFGAYTLDWSSRDIVGVWPDYAEAMQAMAARLHHDVAREQVLIGELLAGSQWTRRRHH